MLLPICLGEGRVPAVPLLLPPVAMETHPFIRLDYHNRRRLFSEVAVVLFVRVFDLNVIPLVVTRSQSAVVGLTLKEYFGDFTLNFTSAVRSVCTSGSDY